MDAQKLGLFIASIRKERGMTQSELAAKLFVSDKTISKWERGAGFPDIKNIEPLAKALDVSLVELIQGERNTGEFISTQVAEKMIADTITIRTSSNHIEQVVGRIFLAIILCAAIFVLLVLLQYGRIVLISVTSILLGLAGWFIPVRLIICKREVRAAVYVWISMGLAAMSVGTQFFDIYCNVQAHDWSAIEDTISALLLVVALFLAVSIILNGIMVWKHRKY